MNPQRLLLCIALLPMLAFGSACERAGLYDLAKNGEGLVYIVTKDGASDVRLYVTTGEDYFKQYYVGMTPNVIEGVFASERGEVFILRTIGDALRRGGHEDFLDARHRVRRGRRREYTPEDRHGVGPHGSFHQPACFSLCLRWR
jgi:hypothetical protein